MEEGRNSAPTNRTPDMNAATSRRSRGSLRSLRADLPALSTIVLFFLASFGQFLFRGQFLIGGDAFFYQHPLRTIAFKMIRDGELPVWTPLIWTGYPLLAMSSVGIGYPLNWTHLFLPSHWALQIYVLAPFLLTPIFTYLFVRSLNLTRTAALVAALSFTYGGLMTNTYGMNGIPANALMWLPLLLFVIERSLRTSFASSLVAAALIYSLSILTGHGQGFLQVGTLALAYAFFLSIRDKQNRRHLRGWRPVISLIIAMVFAVGICAFQILETMRAARRSIRATLTAEQLGAGGFTLRGALQSFAAPLFNHLETTTYQAPFILLLAIAGVVLLWRTRDGRESRVLFWALVAVIAFVLLLGGNTPAYQLLYHVPVFNLVRRPTRYAFEFTFAISVLAAYGWDAANRYIESKFNLKAARLDNVLVLLAIVLTIGLAIGWWRSIRYGGLQSNYLYWKFAFTAVTTAAIIWSLFSRSSATYLGTTLLLIVCFVEPFILIGKWWAGTAKPAARFTTPAVTTAWLQQFPPEQQRVYVRANGPDEESATQPRFDALDRSMLFGLHNVAGYEPFLLERYSRVLGNVEFDAVGPRAGFALTNDLFESKSHVLDLLNTGFVVTWPNLATVPETNMLERNGARFAKGELQLVLEPGKSASLTTVGAKGDRLLIVTSLAHSVAVAQGTVVARVHVVPSEGQEIELPLRAGIETAEWAHERADVRTVVQHQLASVFDSQNVENFSALRYVTNIPLETATAIREIRIENVSDHVQIAVWKLTVYDTLTGQSQPIGQNTTSLDPDRWEIAKELDGVQILRNRRSLPRVWLVTDAEAVNGEIALQRISSDPDFDPRRTALLEVAPNELPQLPGGTTHAGDEARIIDYRSSQLTIETNAATNSLLVVSEMFYPGWEATIDGQPTRIMLTDYVLRGVAIPSGKHRIEMRYRAPAARNGAIVSAISIFVLLGLLVYSRRKPKLSPSSNSENTLSAPPT